jgi:hypothetical protein
MSHRAEASELGLRDRPTTTLRGSEPARQRNGWSFLTWAFFLPNLAASEVFFGTGAKAAAQDETQGRQEAPDTSTGMDSSLGEVPYTAISSDPGEVSTPPSGGSAPYSNQSTSTHALMDVQDATTVLGPKGAVGESDTGSSGGGGGGGSEVIGFSLDASNADKCVPCDPALDHLSDLLVDVAVSNLHDNRIQVLSDLGAASGLATDDGGDSRPAGGGVSYLPAAPSSSSLEIAQPHELLNQPPGFGDLGHNNGQAASNTSILDLFPEGGMAVEVKALLGFEIGLSADDLTAKLGAGSFGDLLGFDAQISAEGILAGGNVGLQAAGSTAESLVAGVASIVNSGLRVADADLGSILAVDSHFGSVLLPELLGSASSAIAQSVKSTLVDVTGVQLFGGIGEGQTSQLLAEVSSAANGAVTQATESASVAQLGGSLTKAHVLSDLSEISGLTHKGDVSSGDVINFPGQPFAFVDQLFSGPQYTDYNVTLQTPKSGAAEHGAATSINSGAADIVPAIVDVPLSHDRESIPATSDQTNDNLLHTSLAVLQLASH